MINVVSGANRRREALNACLESVTGLVRPNPPSRTGKLNKSRSTLEHGDLPVSAGMKV